ncbi:MAG TPA: S26 family signal peptidase [Polyangiaceae bacterium]|jgi:signal peptidase I
MRTWLKFVGWASAIIGAVLLVLYIFFFDVWRVPADDPMLAASIEPTLSAGDLVVVTRRTTVSRGNLLRCADPQAAGRFVVARAIARYGDEVAIQDEVVSIDGKRTPSPRACDPPTMLIHDPQSGDDVNLHCSIEEYGEMTFASLRQFDHAEPPTKATIEAGKWYLVSDDRHVHVDSRDFGQIDPNTCQHIVFRLVGADGFSDGKKRFNVIW